MEFYIKTHKCFVKLYGKHSPLFLNMQVFVLINFKKYLTFCFKPIV